MTMFCYQCQEAAKGTGCTKVGVCGKKDETANLQDVLVYVTKGVSIIAESAMSNDIEISSANHFVIEALFVTITNGNFDDDAIIKKIREGIEIREHLKSKLHAKVGELPPFSTYTTWLPESDTEIKEKCGSVGVLSETNEDIRSLKELLIYGVKGIAAYAEHASNLSYTDNSVFVFIHKAMVATTQTDVSVDDMVALVLECGEYGVKVMALLDKANTESYGHPEISSVNIGVRDNPGILISGHDLKDMEELLMQTQGTGVDVYTHSEMLPANYYPELKKYENFVGNYGNSWWMQKDEFDSFNGAILFTSNCIVPPKESCQGRIYTTNTAGFAGCKHIPDRVNGNPKDFSGLIAHAKKLASPTEIESGEIVGGFAHHQVLELADKVVDAVKSGAIKKFIVMAGCDGRMKSRDYYTEFAKALPEDTVILTAGCAKYRYNKLGLGDIGGIPRVLDAGQCNDSYSLVVIAMKLQEVFGLDDINDLPIAYNIAWYEQKAVIVLLALLSLGVQNIHLGPTLPAFLSPNVAQVLIDNFGIAGIGTVEDDLIVHMA